VVFDVDKVSGIGKWERSEDQKIFSLPGGKAFLAIHANSIEVRTDRNLKKLLTEKYESVMESRYFGRGGVEVVLSGQLEEDEVYDLVRLSYNLSKS
jgi:predicted DNA-binding protein (MmcQ/YjbR family)